MEEILPAIGLGFVDSGICLSTRINPFLPILIDSAAEVVTVADLCSDVWVDQKLRFLTRFVFADVKCS